MNETPNKVRFTVDNVHYAKLTETVSQGVVSYSYATPVHIPGTSNLDLSPEGDVQTFRADGIDYFIGEDNNGYSGNWENAVFPDKMLQDIWNMIKDADDKTLVEFADAETSEFALLFRIRGDKYKRNCVLYRCTAGRPNVGSSGSSGNKEVQPQSVTINARPRADGKIRSCTTHETPTSVVNGWYTAVYDKTPSTTPSAPEDGEEG